MWEKSVRKSLIVNKILHKRIVILKYNIEWSLKITFIHLTISIKDTIWLFKADKEFVSYLNSSTLLYFKSFTILD